MGPNGMMGYGAPGSSPNDVATPKISWGSGDTPVYGEDAFNNPLSISRGMTPSAAVFSPGQFNWKFKFSVLLLRYVIEKT